MNGIKEKRIKILVVHHKEYEYIKNNYLQPIQVGRVLKNFNLEYCIPDNTGENISEKNDTWCELTALYWAWKNLDADVYGLCHYRRYLSFQDNENYNVITSTMETDFQKSMTEENIWKMCSQYDIITGPIWEIHPAGVEKSMTGYEFYKKEHIISDLNITLKIIEERFPEYYYAALNSLTSEQCFFMNLMVLRKDLFFKYCEFLFGVLERAEKEISLIGRDAYQRRVFGFLAERLSNIFLTHITSQDDTIKIKHTGMFFLAEKNNIDIKAVERSIYHKVPLPACEEKINICMSFDDNYLAPALTAIVSLLKKTNSVIRFYILCDDQLSSNSRELICLNAGNRNEVQFIDVDAKILKKFPLNREYISINTYYRLLIQNLIPVNKIIYLDADIIVCDDLVNLWNEDLHGKCMGGVLDEGGITQARRLNMRGDVYYFNAGILLIDLKTIRDKYKNPMDMYLRIYYANRKYITLQDQDILNLSYKNDMVTLPLRWNINGRIFEVNELDHKYNAKDVDAALKDVGILHYTDRKKPWKFIATHPLKSLYWKNRKQVKGLPMTRDEKMAMFLQKYVCYKIKENDLLIKVCGISFCLDKNKVKRGLKLLHFKF